MATDDDVLHRAETAWKQGNGFFQVELMMRSINQARKFMVGLSQMQGGKYNVRDTGTKSHTDILSQIESVGWRLEQMSHVWVVTGQQSRERIWSAGQDVGMMGELVGVYLFRRFEEESQREAARLVESVDEAIRRRSSSDDLSEPAVLREIADEVDLIRRELAVSAAVVVLREREEQLAQALARAEATKTKASQEPLTWTESVKVIRFEMGFTVSQIGLVVSSVTAGMAADLIGLRVEDRVLRAWGEEVTSIAELGTALSRNMGFGGKVLELEVMRGSERITL